MSADPQDVVTVAVIGTGVFTSVGYIRAQHSIPPPRIIAGTIITGAVLSLLAEFAPQLAAAFASVLLITAMFVVGSGAWQGIAATVAPSPALAPHP